MRPTVLAALALLLAAACKEDDPAATPDGPPRPDAMAPDAGLDATPVDANPECQPLATDYQPRDRNSANDDWPACVSDDDVYVPFDQSISTIARVAAFEEIATLLFGGGAPDAQAFIDARVQYNLDQGLASRVQRREDEHYPPATWDVDDDGTAEVVTCQAITGIPAALAANADRCVGPARISPLIEAAFDAGQTGGATELERRVAAAELEAALLWFFYVSVHKEAVTCTNVPRDCDSHWAYYAGGDPRGLGKGLARYVKALDVETHDRIYDGTLAVRCWRDLDNPTGVAEDLELRDRAIGQLDRAALRGVMLIVRDRVVEMAGATGDARAVVWEFLRVLGPVLDRDATARDAGTAAALRAELAKEDPETVDADAIVDALDALYPCP